MSLLFIKCSPLQKTPRQSISTLVGEKFIEKYCSKNEKEDVEVLDLNTSSLGTTCLTSNNLMSFGQSKESQNHINLLKKIDKVVIATPMINFNFPVTLMNYLNNIFVPGITFKFVEENGVSVKHGLLNNLKVQIITTQGADLGWYQWGNHTETLKACWDFVGAKIAKPLAIYGTNTPDFITKKAPEILETYLSNIEIAVENFAKK